MLDSADEELAEAADKDKELAAGLPGSVDAYKTDPNVDVVSLGSDDFADSLAGVDLQLEQDKSQQLLIVPCSMVVLAHTIPGTLAFTRTYLTFTADDSTTEYEKASYLVRVFYSFCILHVHVNLKCSTFFQADYCCLNDQWSLQDVAAVFSRRYLHQNRAVEIFFSDRSSAFFVFESSRDVRNVVSSLPKVGIGSTYDFPQTRSVSNNDVYAGI